MKMIFGFAAFAADMAGVMAAANPITASAARQGFRRDFIVEGAPAKRMRAQRWWQFSSEVTFDFLCESLNLAPLKRAVARGGGRRPCLPFRMPGLLAIPSDLGRQGRLPPRRSRFVSNHSCVLLAAGSIALRRNYPMRLFFVFLAALAVATPIMLAAASSSPAKPNVLFIAVDD